MRNKLILIFIGFVLLGFLLHSREEKTKGLSAKEPSNEVAPLTEPSSALPSVKSEKEVKIAPGKSDESFSVDPSLGRVVPLTRDQLRLPSFPNQTQLREELLKNPHTTPPVLVEFANNLGPMMETALNPDVSQEALASIVEQLTRCVKTEEVSMSVRALCYVNLARIHKQHPNVEAADVSRIEVPDRLRQLAEPLLNSI